MRKTTEIKDKRSTSLTQTFNRFGGQICTLFPGRFHSSANVFGLINFGLARCWCGAASQRSHADIQTYSDIQAQTNSLCVVLLPPNVDVLSHTLRYMFGRLIESFGRSYPNIALSLSLAMLPQQCTLAHCNSLATATKSSTKTIKQVYILHCCWCS